MLKSYVIRLGLSVLFVASFSNTSHAQITFTKHCETEVIKLINNSHYSIDIAVYSINNQSIIEALQKAKQRNVIIRILTDRIQAFGKSSKAKLLHDQGFEIKIHSKQRIMHHKFAIFDNTKAIEGSFNWTYSAANKHVEDCNVIRNKNDVKTLTHRFKKLWKQNKREPSECYFRNMDLAKLMNVIKTNFYYLNLTLLKYQYYQCS